MIDYIAQLTFMLSLWLCLVLGFVAFLAMAEFTNMSEGMGRAYHVVESSKVKL